MMKTFFSMAVIVLAFLISCKKGNNETAETPEKDCPIVAANLVPQVVKDSFMHRYPMDSVQTWFNKDSVAYCAYFISSGTEKLAQFSNSGNFVKEEIESNESNGHEDSTHTGKTTTTGCECEVHDEHD